MDIQSILGSVALGKDTTGNFKQSIYGLAVRTNTDGKFIAYHRNKYTDVSSTTIDGTDNLVYRLPVKVPKPGDIIIRSDDPFSVMFVEKISEKGNVIGFDPSTEDMVEYRPVTNIFNFNFFVKVIGPNSFLGDKSMDKLMPLLLLSNQGGAADSGNPLSALLLMRSLGKEDTEEESILPLLLLSSQGGAGLDPLTLMLALKGNGDFNLFGEERQETSAKAKK